MFSTATRRGALATLEALAMAFSRHRSAAGRNAGYRGRDRAHIWTPA